METKLILSELRPFKRGHFGQFLQYGEWTPSTVYSGSF